MSQLTAMKSTGKWVSLTELLIIYLDNYGCCCKCDKRASGCFTSLLGSETDHNPQILFDRVHGSFQTRLMRKLFWAAEHARVNLTVCRTFLLSFVWVSLWLCWSDCPEWWLELSLLAGRIVQCVGVLALLRFLFLAQPWSVDQRFRCSHCCFFKWLFLLGSCCGVDYFLHQL